MTTIEALQAIAAGKRIMHKEWTGPALIEELTQDWPKEGFYEVGPEVLTGKEELIRSLTRRADARYQEVVQGFNEMVKGYNGE